MFSVLRLPLGRTETAERGPRETPLLAVAYRPAVETPAVITSELVLEDFELRIAKLGPRKVPVDAVHRLYPRMESEYRLPGTY